MSEGVGPLCRFLYQDGGLCLWPEKEHAMLSRRTRLSAHPFHAPEPAAEPACWHCRRDQTGHDVLLQNGWAFHPFTDADEREKLDAAKAAAREAARGGGRWA